MPYGILKFKLPEEQEDFQLAQDAWKWKSACTEMDNWLRMQIKHGDRDDLQAVRDKLREFMEDEGLKE